jgi:hypothetical protein
MAKRRNAKKEKAARNKVNARQFRKQPARNSSRGRRFSNTEKKTEDAEDNKSSSSN